MSFLEPSITEQTEIILNNPVEVRKATDQYSNTGDLSYMNEPAPQPRDAPQASDAALLRAIELLSANYDKDELSDADNELLDSVWRVAFPQG